MRRLVYTAGPFAGSIADIDRNVGRALGLGRLATAQGLCPIVPHAMGWLGVHGEKDESVPGVREAALSCGSSLADAVARAGGTMWIIVHPDGTLSSGTRLELDVFLAASGTDVVCDTWGGWRGRGAEFVDPHDFRLHELDQQIAVYKDEMTRLQDLVDQLRSHLR